MPTIQEISLAHATYYETLLRDANELCREGGASFSEGIRLFDSNWENIRLGHAHAETFSPNDTTATKLCNDYLNFPYLFDLRLHPRDRIRYLEPALTAARRLGQRDAESSHLGNLGLAYLDLGEPFKAIDFFKQQFAIASDSDDWRGQMATAGNLGLACSKLNKKELAVRFYREQKKIARLISDQQGECSALCNIGLTLIELNDARKAIRYLKQALKLARTIGQRRLEAATLVNIGYAHSRLGNVRKEIESYESASAIADEIGDREAEGAILWNMSLLCAAVDMRGRAILFAESALKIYEETQDPRADEVRKQLTKWKSHH